MQEQNSIPTSHWNVVCEKKNTIVPISPTNILSLVITNLCKLKLNYLPYKDQPLLASTFLHNQIVLLKKC